MRLIGYSCIEIATENEYHHSFTLPMKVPHPTNPFGTFVTFDGVGQVAPDIGPIYQLVERWGIEAPTSYHARGVQSVSFDGTKIIVDPGWVLGELTKVVDTKKAGVKGKAANLIIAAFPEWKQRNMISEGVSLLDAYRLKGSWTVGEQTRSDELNVIWAKIIALRAHSDTLEAEIDTLAAAIGNDEDRAKTINDWIDHDWPSLK